MAKKDYSNWSKEELLKELKKIEKRKKYGIVWEDKPEQVAELCKEKLPVLVEDKGKEIKTDDTKPVNILIEGDNYHALSVLNYTHKGKIDVIYIDPPYNTGKKGEWKYNDYWVDEEDAYRHSKWLSFMNKRLELAKDLLSKTGVIFINIDDNEIAQLKLLCGEVFNERNVDIVIWKKIDPKYDRNVNAKITKRTKRIHEFILVVYKNKEETTFDKIKKLPNWSKKKSNPDNDPRGGYESGILSFEEGHKNEDKNSEYYYTITTPSGRKITRHFFIIQDEFNELMRDNRIYFPKKGDGVPRLKIFENEEKDFYFETILEGVGSLNSAKKELADIFGVSEEKVPFDTPKPTKLVKEIIRASAPKNALVLDFFVGSGTTGHAVMELNKEDGGNRKFILVTNNEVGEKSEKDFKTKFSIDEKTFEVWKKENREEWLQWTEKYGICSGVCYPRLHKVIEGYKNLKGEDIEGLGGNLKYFKTDFVDAEPTDKNKKKMVDKSTEMLCLKEDCFDEIKKGQDFRIFNNKKDKYLGVIYDDDGIEPFKKEARMLRKKFIVYVFSLDESAREEEFEDVADLVELKPIPAAILNVYRRIFK